MGIEFKEYLSLLCVLKCSFKLKLYLVTVNLGLG